MRKIIHIDMDSFFASVEQRDFPEHAGKALVVGGRGPRSVVAAASYEARTFGVHSAMPMSIALRKCPDLIIMPHRFDVYKAVSLQINEVFHEYTDLVETLSLDEAFLDVTAQLKGPASASLIAMEIKTRIREVTGLTASAGVSYNKFLAKVASDVNKPDGFFLIRPGDAQAFLENLPVGRFFGVGKRTEEKMHSMNIHCGRDLLEHSRVDLMTHFGRAGAWFYDVARGVDERPVVPEREAKSIGAERTFAEDLFEAEDILPKMKEILDSSWDRCLRKEKFGRTLTLKCRYADFRTITRSRSQEEQYTVEQAYDVLLDLIPLEMIRERGTRLIGVTFSHFDRDEANRVEQLEFEFDADV